MTTDDDMFSRILEKYYSAMTPAEQRVADYLIKNPHESIRLSVNSLARNAQTSEATVVRFARSLGFKGFLELKAELLRRASHDLADPTRYPRIHANDGKDLLCAIANQEITNIEKTIAQLSLDHLHDFTRALHKAPMIYTLGSGSSSSLAQMSSYQLTLIGKRSIFLRYSPSSLEEQLRLAQAPHDVLWVFSFPPYNPAILRAVEFAKGHGLTCVAVTDRSLSPVTPLVETALYAANDSLFPSNSLIASIILIRTLISQLALDSPATDQARELAVSTQEALNRLTELGEVNGSPSGLEM